MGVMMFGCGSTPQEPPSWDTDIPVPQATDADTPAQSSVSTDADTDADADGTGSPSISEGDEVLYDVGAPDLGDADEADGCSKIDFLFVIDRSVSMKEKQALLTQNVPGFLDAIVTTLDVSDFHILVTDTDGPSMDCYERCEEIPSLLRCSGTDCGQHPEPGTCDATLGAGLVKSHELVPCGVPGPGRFLDAETEALSDVFACIANVGVGGDIHERQAGAIVNALGPELGAAEACNAGFVRPDAILVVVVVTDEPDQHSDGDVDSWRAAIIDAKSGNESAVVMLGLLGDSDEPGGLCAPLASEAPLGGADPAPQLRELIESFPAGEWGSVCAPDYAPFLVDAIEHIDSSCEDFVPAG